MARPLILVLGGYGFIGAEIVRALEDAGMRVRALGRDPALAEAAGPAGVQRLVQVSAVGAHAGAGTDFLATKAAGDRAVRESGLEHVILRPGLVMGRTVYGGTALLRMLAAVPWVQPLAWPSAPVQVVGMEDLTRAVLAAVRGELPTGLEADLVAEPPVTLDGLVAAIRRWLGFAPARLKIPVPGLFARGVSAIADGLGRLGWRSPLRSTATRVLSGGVTGNPGPWRDAGQPAPAGLEAILSAHPATLQDRWHARLALLFPGVIGGLSAFWLTSGLIGLWQMGPAAATLAGTGLPDVARWGAVIGGALADIALGVLVLVRRRARVACLGMVALSLGYLVAGTWLTPGLWADPLGPFVKVVPAILLALVALALLEER